MRQTKREIMTGVEYVKSKLVDHNTVEYHCIDGTKVIRLHRTDILVFKPNGDVVLNSGGWQTVVTKERMNGFLPKGWGIYQEKNVWYLSKGEYWSDPDRKSWVYQDGITILGTGGVSGASKDRKKLDKRLKDIRVYVDGFMKKLVARELPQPGNGDCWFCLFKDKDGRTRSDHILEHFKDKYYVPSLLMNAIAEIPVSQTSKSSIGYWFKVHDQECTWFEDISKEQVKKSLTRYLKRRLGMAA
uniref:Uncharacterized protein n=1 Tax=viral metagenome TaxID=1070528 RepID=A0A6M3LK84_9ZZZZ